MSVDQHKTISFMLNVIILFNLKIALFIKAQSYGNCSRLTLYRWTQFFNLNKLLNEHIQYSVIRLHELYIIFSFLLSIWMFNLAIYIVLYLIFYSPSYWKP